MTVELTNISHGSSNWEDNINQNFNNLGVDSDWISVPILAPFEGTCYFRMSAHCMEIMGSFKSTDAIAAADGVPVANFPEIGKNRSFVALSDGRNAFARFVLNANGILSFLDSTEDITSFNVRFSKTISI